MRGLELDCSPGVLYLLDSKACRVLPGSIDLWMLGFMVPLMSYQRLRGLRIPVSVGLRAVNDGPDFLQLLIRQLDLS